MMASVEKYSAWRSRWTIWEETGAGFRPQFPADIFLDRRINEGKCSHGAGEFSHADRLLRPDHSFPVPFHLRIPEGHLQAECNRFRMDTVRSSDHERILVGKGLLPDRGQQKVYILNKDIGCLPEKKPKRGVEYIGGGQPPMNETAILPDLLRHGGEKGDDIMLCRFLDLIDPVHVETGPFPDVLH